MFLLDPIVEFFGLEGRYDVPPVLIGCVIIWYLCWNRPKKAKKALYEIHQNLN